MRAARRVALVTGSSRGLGRAIAHRLAADGLAVAVNDAHGGERAVAVAAAITEEGGVAAAFGADVTDEAQVWRMVEAVEAALGPVDVLVAMSSKDVTEAPAEQRSSARQAWPAEWLAHDARSFVNGPDD